MVRKSTIAKLQRSPPPILARTMSHLLPAVGEGGEQSQLQDSIIGGKSAIWFHSHVSGRGCSKFCSLGAVGLMTQAGPVSDSQNGQTMWPPLPVSAQGLAFHSCTRPQPWMQPGQHSQTVRVLAWVKSAGCAPWLSFGCHMLCMVL